MLKKVIRSNDFIYVLLRRIHMFYVRIVHRLQGVHSTCRVVFPNTISKDFELGAYSLVSRGAYISGKVKAGKYVMIAPDVTIAGSDHIFDQPGVPMYFAGRPRLPETIIGDDVWIGSNVVILPNIKIGKGSVIAAGAVVTSNVSQFKIMGGIPAKEIGRRD